MNSLVGRSFSILRYSLFLTGLSLIIWAVSDDLLIGGGPGFGYGQGLILLAGVGALVGGLWVRKLGPYVLVTYVSIFFALSVGEIALRTIYAPKYTSAFELNDSYLYDLKPGVVKEFTHMAANGGQSHLYRVNSNGFRGEELAERSEVDQRIIFYGDSFIQAIFSEDHATLPVQFQSLLESAGPTSANIEIINAGVAGFGPDQIVIKMEEEVVELEPDLIIVSIFSGNDFGDLVRNKLFRLNDDTGISRVFPSIDPEIKYREELGARELRVRRVLRNLRDAFRPPEPPRDLVRVVNDAYEQQVAEYTEFVVKRDFVVKELRTDPYSADISLVAGSASGNYKIKLMEKIMLKIQRLADESSIPLVFILIPHPVDLMRGDHESGIVDAGRWPNYDSEKLIETLEELCDAGLHTCLSLLDPLRENGGAELYLRGGDDHWNDDGQTVAAQELFRFLNQKELI